MPQTERDRLFLQHLARHRVTTQDVTAKLFCNGASEPARKLLSRLDEHVSSARLYGNVRYYQLTPETARSLGVPEEAGKPLGPQALPTAIGVLGYCCGNETRRFRYTRPDFAEDFPELVEPLCGRRFYLDYCIEKDGAQARLMQIVVDLDADVGDLVEKCRERMREHLARPIVEDLVLGGLFGFALVVGELEKKRALDEAVRRRPLRAPVSVEVVDELSRLPRGKDGG
jgi:hypothetical protein